MSIQPLVLEGATVRETRGPGAPPVLLARQLAVGIATAGDGDVSFWNLETGACLRVLRALPRAVRPSDAYRVPFLSRIHVIGGRVVVPTAGFAALRKPHGRGGTPGAVAASALTLAADELMAAPHGGGGGVRCILPPLPTATLTTLAARFYGAEGLAGDAIAGRGIAEYLLSAHLGDSGAGGASPSAAASGAAFVIGGIRGAGAERRQHGSGPFALAYSFVQQQAQQAQAQAAPAGGTGGAPPPPPVRPGGRDLAYVYGGSHLEGLPVWLLTAGDAGRSGDPAAGSGGVVRCWDLDRPRASHTVCGLELGVTREGYEGVWAHSVAPRRWVGEDEEDADEGVGAAAEEAGDSEADDDEAAGGDDEDAEADEAGLPFRAHYRSDGLGSLAPRFLPERRRHLWQRQAGAGGSGTRYREPRRRRLPAALRERLSLPRDWQPPQPVRTILMQPLYDPSNEGGFLGSAGIPANPARLLRGPLPSEAGHAAAVTAMAWLDVPSRLLLTGSADGSVKIWR